MKTIKAIVAIRFWFFFWFFCFDKLREKQDFRNKISIARHHHRRRCRISSSSYYNKAKKWRKKVSKQQQPKTRTLNVIFFEKKSRNHRKVTKRQTNKQTNPMDPPFIHSFTKHQMKMNFNDFYSERITFLHSFHFINNNSFTD